MQNPRLASRYAKSLLDIALEQNVLEAVRGDMELIQQVGKTNPDLVLMLKSPVIKGDKKLSVFKAVFEGRVQQVTLLFIELLVRKGREFFLPEIATAFASQYKTYKHINTVSLTTAVAIDDQLKQLIHSKVATSLTDGHIELNTEVDESLIGGFVLQVGDKLFDASIRRDLVDIKAQFTKNLYVAEI